MPIPEANTIAWPNVRLERVTSKVGSGATPRGGDAAYQKSGTPLIRSMNIRFEGFTRKGLAFIDEAQAAELDNVTVQANDVLFNITGASIGRVTVAPSEMAGARVNQHVCIMRTAEVLNPHFLAYFFTSAEQQSLIHGNQTGGTRQALTKRQLLDWKCPLPAASEQRRVVELLGQADAIRRQRTEADALSARILPALFHKMFGEQERVSEWPLVNLGQVTAIDAPMVDPREPEFSALPHIGPDRIEGRTGRLLPALTARQEKLISGKFLFDQRHVLYSKIRPYLRKVALPEAIGLCSADMYPVTPLDRHATREYVWALLLSDAFTNFTAERSGRANIPKVNREQFAAYTFRLPPLPIQRDFSDKVDGHRKLAAQQGFSRDNIERLFHTMLHRAFTGELTARWREAHMKELLVEMEQQAKALGLSTKVAHV